jgi:hypothetical protein
VSCCPRSSLPADVLAWLVSRLAHLLPSRPPGQGGTPPLCWRGLLYRVRDVFRAAGALICLGRWLYRVPV